MSTRKPVAAARTTRPLPRVDQLAAAGVALGAVALGGCNNPFEGSREHPSLADLQPDLVDPAASLASMFATSPVNVATHDAHIAYPLAAVAAVAASQFAHAANAEPTPPAPKVTTPPVGRYSTFMGGAMAISTPRPPIHLRGAIRTVHTAAPPRLARTGRP